MAERQRHAGTKIAIGELLVVGDIGPADARRLDGNLNLTTPWLLDGSSFLGSC